MSAAPPPCAKRRYPTLAIARETLEQAKLDRALRGDPIREQRAYYHPGCKAYHLTSRPLNAPQEGTRHE